MKTLTITITDDMVGDGWTGDLDTLATELATALNDYYDDWDVEVIASNGNAHWPTLTTPDGDYETLERNLIPEDIWIDVTSRVQRETAVA